MLVLRYKHQRPAAHTIIQLALNSEALMQITAILFAGFKADDTLPTGSVSSPEESRIAAKAMWTANRSFNL